MKTWSLPMGGVAQGVKAPHFILAVLSPVLMLSSTGFASGVVTSSLDGGGHRATSASYTMDGSVGGIGGISISQAPAETLKHGYVGQLYEVSSLSASAAPAYVAEASTAQLSGLATLDDATTTALSGADIQWAVMSGPIVGVSASGVATADIVYTNQPASIQGIYLGAAAQVALIVVDSIPDNFGAYAGDGLPDWWQIHYFGLNNPNAAPNADPDHDGDNNWTEFMEGTDPTSSASAFILRIADVTGQPTRKDLVFGPIVPGRVYTVQFTSNLTNGSFASLTGTSQVDNGSQRRVTDLNALQSSKFYRVGVRLALPVLRSPARHGNNFSFLLQTVSGFNYLVEYKTSLTDPAWTPLQWVLGDGQAQTVTDTSAPPVGRFYRVRR